MAEIALPEVEDVSNWIKIGFCFEILIYKLKKDFFYNNEKNPKIPKILARFLQNSIGPERTIKLIIKLIVW
jgi:hypothetical protein